MEAPFRWGYLPPATPCEQPVRVGCVLACTGTRGKRVGAGRAVKDGGFDIFRLCDRSQRVPPVQVNFDVPPAGMAVAEADPAPSDGTATEASAPAAGADPFAFGAAALAVAARGAAMRLRRILRQYV